MNRNSWYLNFFSFFFIHLYTYRTVGDRERQCWPIIEPRKVQARSISPSFSLLLFIHLFLWVGVVERIPCSVSITRYDHRPWDNVTCWAFFFFFFYPFLFLFLKDGLLSRANRDSYNGPLISILCLILLCALFLSHFYTHAWKYRFPPPFQCPAIRKK